MLLPVKAELPRQKTRQRGSHASNRKLGDFAGLDDCMAALKDCQRLHGTPLELEAQRLETEAKSLCFF